MQQLLRWNCDTANKFLALPLFEMDYFRRMHPTDFTELAKLVTSEFSLSCFRYVDSNLPTTFDPSTIDSKQDLYFVTNTGGAWCISEQRDRMIRPGEYAAVWSQLKCLLDEKGANLEGNGLLVKGHPGIGKSLLLDLLLSWSLFSYPTMPVIVLAAEQTYLFVSGKRYTSMPSTNFVHELPLLIPRGTQILVLHDIKTTQSLSYQCSLVRGLKRMYLTTVVLASSPQEGNYKDFRKDILDRIEYILPTLSAEEADRYLSTVFPLLSNAERANIFYEVGGVPRHFNVREHALQLKRMSTGAKSIKFDPFVHTVPKESAEATIAVVAGVPSKDRTEYEVYDFVSRKARALWFEAVPAHELILLLQRLRVAEDEQSRDVFGRVFERWALVTLKSSLRLCYQRMNRGAKSVGVPQEWQVKLPLRELPFFEISDLPRQCKVPTLCVPKTPQFPVVDAILICGKKATLIQVTVTNSHKPTVEQVRILLKGLDDQGLTVDSMVWIVDMSARLSQWQEIVAANPNKQKTIDSVTINRYNAIPQFLCRLSECMFWAKDGAKDAVCFPVTQADDMTNVATVARLIKKHLQISKLTLGSTSSKGTIDDPLTFN